MKMKRQTVHRTWEKICKSYVTWRSIVLNLFLKFLKHNNKMNSTKIQLKNMTKMEKRSEQTFLQNDT